MLIVTECSQMPSTPGTAVRLGSISETLSRDTLPKMASLRGLPAIRFGALRSTKRQSDICQLDRNGGAATSDLVETAQQRQDKPGLEVSYASSQLILQLTGTKELAGQLVVENGLRSSGNLAPNAIVRSSRKKTLDHTSTVGLPKRALTINCTSTSTIAAFKLDISLSWEDCSAYALK
ncbi:hypothetical protein BDZ91DRAFT_783040 [Kalaharituber pfeilii]|nr:hypothetical protein BDZ91DRAFT_783040 [Kalaharituber pfeilii]